MAWRSSLAVLVLVLAAPRAAAAECEGDLAFTLVSTHVGVVPEPAAEDGLGVELWLRGPSVTWGKGCTGGRHRFDFTESEAPSYGDYDRVSTRFGRYTYAWHAGDLTVHAGATAMTLWGDNLRFVTPVIGVAGEQVHELLLRAQLESAGVFAFALDRVTRDPLDDLALTAEAVWPARAAVRYHARVRQRRYDFDGKRVRDLTLTAGLGAALAARDRQRALPGFVGVSYRRGEGITQVMGVLEVGFGLDAW